MPSGRVQTIRSSTNCPRTRRLVPTSRRIRRRRLLVNVQGHPNDHRRLHLPLGCSNGIALVCCRPLSLVDESLLEPDLSLFRSQSLKRLQHLRERQDQFARSQRRLLPSETHRTTRSSTTGALSASLAWMRMPQLLVRALMLQLFTFRRTSTSNLQQLLMSCTLVPCFLSLISHWFY